MNSQYLTNHFINLSTKNNYIINAIVYSLNDLNEIENKIINNVLKIQTYLNDITNNSYNLEYISKAIIFLYNSYRIITNLPHMLDKIKDKKKPCVHIIYGEMVTQLSSVTLFSEAINILNNLDYTIDKNRNQIICDNFKTISDKSLDINPELINNKKMYKILLEDDYRKKIKILNEKIIDLSINIYKKDINIKNLKNKLIQIIQ